MKSQKITALLDGSVYSKSVCDHAIWLANRLNSSVELLHVLGRRDVSSQPSNLSGSIGLGARTALLEELAELDGQKAKLAQKRGRAILDDAKELVTDNIEGDVSTKLVNGDLSDTLSENENKADLIVIGKRGEAADFAQLHLGSNLERVARTAEVPVLVTSRAFLPIGKVLIAFDGGKSVIKAVSYLAETKLLEGKDVTLLHVGEQSKQVQKDLEGAASLLRDSGCVVDIQVEEGQVETLISAKVDRDETDMIVMGAYGHSRIRQLIIGSTTTEMLRSCKVPILLFR
ncbi:MAG: universal stress protein [Alphaproteobacteria bacterium]